MTSSTSSSAQVHNLLHEYTDSVDALPLDLTRSFGDLRELDAVLRSSMQLITQKIYRLAELMKDPTITPSERLLLLVEIAEDAQRLKMGSEDKIRVAGRTCDDLALHNQHNAQILSMLSALDPAFESALHMRRTTFPHVAPSNLVTPSPDSILYMNGRRKRVPTANNGISIGGGGAMSGSSKGITGTNGLTNGGGGNNGIGIRRRRGDEDDAAGKKTPKGKEKEKEKEREREREREREKERMERERHKAKKLKTSHNARSPSPFDEHEHLPYRILERDVPRHQSQYDRQQVGYPEYHHNYHERPPNGHMHGLSHQQLSSRMDGPHPMAPQSYPPPPPGPEPFGEPNHYPHYVDRPRQANHHFVEAPMNGGYPPPMRPHHPHQPGSYPPPQQQGMSSQSLDATAMKKPTKPTGTSSLLDVVASRAQPQVNGNPNNPPMPPGAMGRVEHGPSAAFDDDDYEVMAAGGDMAARNELMRRRAGVEYREPDNRAGNGNYPLAEREDYPAFTHAPEPTGGVPSGGGDAGDGTGAVVDPDEPIYCYCQRVSFGEMIGCDDDECKMEWFHLSCLSMSAPPKGEWYCSECTAKRERASGGGGKKNPRNRAGNGAGGHSRGASTANHTSGSNGSGGGSGGGVNGGGNARGRTSGSARV